MQTATQTPLNPDTAPTTLLNASEPVLTDDRAASHCCSSSDDASSIHPTTGTRTGEFLAAVRAASPAQRLIFELGGSALVGPGYHVTEVKAVTYETMDCGGVADRWRETVVQLWNPGTESERGHMTVEKFLAIYDRVAGHVSVFADAELRFEYGDSSRPASSYHVNAVENTGELVIVHLRAPAVTCKARDREQSMAAANRYETDGRCCG